MGYVHGVSHGSLQRVGGWILKPLKSHTHSFYYFFLPQCGTMLRSRASPTRRRSKIPGIHIPRIDERLVFPPSIPLAEYHSVLRPPNPQQRSTTVSEVSLIFRGDSTRAWDFCPSVRGRSTGFEDRACDPCVPGYCYICQSQLRIATVQLNDTGKYHWTSLVVPTLVSLNVYLNTFMTSKAASKTTTGVQVPVKYHRNRHHAICYTSYKYIRTHNYELIEHPHFVRLTHHSSLEANNVLFIPMH